MSKLQAFQVSSSKFQVKKATATWNLKPETCNSSLLSARGLEKSYRKAKVVVPVLKGVDLLVREGGCVAVVGQSGCGKSTLLHLLGTLDATDAGEIQFQGQRIDKLGPRSA